MRRNPVKNRQGIWFAEVEEVHDGIDIVKKISEPVGKKMTVTNTSGSPLELSSGISPEYERVATSYDTDFCPNEGCYVYVDCEPIMDTTGDFILNDKGEMFNKPDYVLEKRIYSRKNKVVRYGLKRVQS